MANQKPTPPGSGDTTPPVDTTPTSTDPGMSQADVLEARVRELEAENAVLRDAVEAPAPAGEPRLVWVVTYPRVSVQPKDEDGEPKGEPVTLEKGQILPDDCLWQAEFLKSVGYISAFSVPAQ